MEPAGQEELGKLEDPVKLLVDMAKQGKIDPWNIDVVEVADKFLLELERARKLDLRISGRVLLYAAILTRMKAEILAEEAVLCVSENEEPPGSEDAIEGGRKCGEDYEFTGTPDYDYYGEIDFGDFEGFGLEGFGLGTAEKSEENLFEDEIIAHLMRPHRKVRRFTTLKDLLRELERAEKTKKKKRDTGSIGNTVLKTPHEEDIEDTISAVEEELKKLFERRDFVTFSELVEGRGLKRKLSLFVSILYLTYRKKIEIEQEKIYEDDILIFPVSRNAEGNAER